MPPISRRAYLVGASCGATAILAGCTASDRETRTPGPGDWTQIGRGSRQTGADTDLSAISDGAIHWRVELGDAFETAGVAVLNDRIVAGGRRGTDDGFLRVLSLADGETEQAIELSTPVIAPPVLSDNSILATCRTDDRIGRLRAFDYDGTERWTHHIGHANPAPPTIHRSTVYAGGTSGTVAALAESDGAVRWERTFADDRQIGPVSAPPTVDETGVYVPVSSSKERGIHALSLEDGTTQWSVRGPRIRSTAARTDDLLLVSYPRYSLVAFDIRTGDRRWSTVFDEAQVSPPAVGDDTVAIADAATLYGFDAMTGEKRWSQPCDPSPYRQPVIAGQTVLVQTGTGLVGCSLTDGEESWTLEDGSAMPIVPVDHGLVVAPTSGVLAAYTNYRA